MLWNAKNGRVALGNATMPYASFGHGKRALVLLPGLSDGLASVQGKALLLAPPYRPFFRDFTVYAFSRRHPLPAGFTIRDMAADQAKAMKSLGIEHACVMGVSQGGMIAQVLTINHPEMVEGLALAVSAPRANGAVRECVHRWISLAERGDHKGLMTDTAEMSYSEKRLKAYRPLYPLMGKMGRPRNYDRFLTNARAILGFDASRELAHVSCPTLIIGGEKDKIVSPRAAHELHRAIAGSELHVYPGLGHGAYEEAKDFNDRVYRFFAVKTIGI